MINTLLTIALVQSLRFAAEVRLRGGFGHGCNLRVLYLDAIDWFDRLADRLFPPERLRLFSQQIEPLEQLEPLSVKQYGRKTSCLLAQSMPC